MQDNGNGLATTTTASGNRTKASINSQRFKPTQIRSGFELAELISGYPEFWDRELLKQYLNKITSGNQLVAVIKANPTFWDKDMLNEQFNVIENGKQILAIINVTRSLWDADMLKYCGYRRIKNCTELVDIINVTRELWTSEMLENFLKERTITNSDIVLVGKAFPEFLTMPFMKRKLNPQVFAVDLCEIIFAMPEADYEKLLEDRVLQNPLVFLAIQISRSPQNTASIWDNFVREGKLNRISDNEKFKLTEFHFETARYFIEKRLLPDQLKKQVQEDPLPWLISHPSIESATFLIRELQIAIRDKSMEEKLAIRNELIQKLEKQIEAENDSHKKAKMTLLLGHLYSNQLISVSGDDSKDLVKAEESYKKIGQDHFLYPEAQIMLARYYQVQNNATALEECARNALDSRYCSEIIKLQAQVFIETAGNLVRTTAASNDDITPTVSAQKKSQPAKSSNASMMSSLRFNLTRIRNGEDLAKSISDHPQFWNKELLKKYLNKIKNGSQLVAVIKANPELWDKGMLSYYPDTLENGMQMLAIIEVTRDRWDAGLLRFWAYRKIKNCTELVYIINVTRELWTPQMLEEIHKIKTNNDIVIIGKAFPEFLAVPFLKQKVSVVDLCEIIFARPDVNYEALLPELIQDPLVSLALQLSRSPQDTDAIWDNFIITRKLIGVPDHQRSELTKFHFETARCFIERGLLDAKSKEKMQEDPLPWLIRHPSLESAIVLIGKLEFVIKDKSIQEKLAVRNGLIQKLENQLSEEVDSDRKAKMNLLLGHFYSNQLIIVGARPSRDDFEKARSSYGNIGQDHFLYPEAQIMLAELYRLYYEERDKASRIRECAKHALESKHCSEKITLQAQAFIARPENLIEVTATTTTTTATSSLASKGVTLSRWNRRAETQKTPPDRDSDIGLASIPPLFLKAVRESEHISGSYDRAREWAELYVRADFLTDFLERNNPKYFSDPRSLDRIGKKDPKKTRIHDEILLKRFRDSLSIDTFVGIVEDIPTLFTEDLLKDFENKIKNGAQLAVIIKANPGLWKYERLIKHLDKIQNGSELAEVISAKPELWNELLLLSHLDKVQNGSELAKVISAKPELWNEPLLLSYLDKVQDGDDLAAVIGAKPELWDKELLTSHLGKIKGGSELAKVISAKPELWDKDLLGPQLGKLINGDELVAVIGAKPELWDKELLNSHEDKIKDSRQMTAIIKANPRLWGIMLMRLYKDKIKDGYQFAQFIDAYPSVSYGCFETHLDKIQSAYQLAQVIKAYKRIYWRDWITPRLDKIRDGYELAYVIEAKPAFWDRELLQSHLGKIKSGHELAAVIKANPELWDKDLLQSQLGKILTEQELFLVIEAKPELWDAELVKSQLNKPIRWSDAVFRLVRFPQFGAVVENFIKSQELKLNWKTLITLSFDEVKYFIERNYLSAELKDKMQIFFLEFLIRYPSEESAIFLIESLGILDRFAPSELDKVMLREMLIQSLTHRIEIETDVDEKAKMTSLLGYLTSNKLIRVEVQRDPEPAVTTTTTTVTTAATPFWLNENQREADVGAKSVVEFELRAR